MELESPAPFPQCESDSDSSKEIHDSDTSLRQDWPWKYWGFKPFDAKETPGEAVMPPFSNWVTDKRMLLSFIPVGISCLLLEHGEM
jgi:hypothetical protein